MADVMPRSHGGDGAGDPPPPGGFGRGQHEEDLIPAKKTRGKAKNKALRQAVALKKGPISLPFDKEVTYCPVGTPNDWFTREVGRYIWGHFAFDKSSYHYVSDHEKNAMERRFDFTEIEKDRECRQLMGDLNAIYMKRYRSRKARAKAEFLGNGGSTDVARARARRHTADETRLAAFKNGHTLKDGSFASQLEEQLYNGLQAEFESRSETNIDKFGEGSASQMSDIQVFEKVLGPRNGHYKGMGRKPSLSRFAPPSCVRPHEQEHTPPALTEDFLDGLFENESFLERLSKFMNSKNASKKAMKNDGQGNLMFIIFYFRLIT